MAVSTGTYSARPSSHSAGDLYLTTDSFWDYLVSNGTKWRHLYSGFECEPPVDSEFAWVNQGGASLVTTNGGVFLRAPATAGTNMRIRVKSAPTAPYTLTAILLPSIPGVSNIGGCGILLRESSTGKLKSIAVSVTGGGVCELMVRSHGSPTDGGSAFPYEHVTDINISAPAIWFQIADDGTSTSTALAFRYSLNGETFTTVDTSARNSAFVTGPDQIGFVADSNNATYDVGATLIHWSQPNPAAPTLRVSSFFLGGGMASVKRAGAYSGAFG